MLQGITEDITMILVCRMLKERWQGVRGAFLCCKKVILGQTLEGLLGDEECVSLCSPRTMFECHCEGLNTFCEEAY